MTETNKAARKLKSDLIGNTYSKAAKHAKTYNLKLLEIAHANANSYFTYAEDLARVTSPSEFAEVSSAYGRKQFEAFTQQTKELAALVRKAATEPAQPVAGFSKSA